MNDFIEVVKEHTNKNWNFLKQNKKLCVKIDKHKIIIIKLSVSGIFGCVKKIENNFRWLKKWIH